MISKIPAAQPSLFPTVLTRGRASAVAHILMLLACVMPFALATQLTFRFQPLRYMDHYRYEANCWFHGKLGACAADGRYLASCPDCSYYDGKPYTGYAPLPAVAQLLTDRILRAQVPTPLIVFAIVCATVYVQFRLTRSFLIRLHGTSYAAATLLAGLLSATLLSCYPLVHNLVVAYSWAQSIVAAQLFLVASTSLLLAYAGTGRLRLILFAGAMCGAAGLSKQNYFAAMPAGVVMTAVLVRRQSPGWRSVVRGCGLFAAPVLIAASVILLWNYARYGDPLQTGSTWVNASNTHPNILGRPRLQRIPYNFYNHFAAPFRVQTFDFPFLAGASSTFGKVNRADGSGGLLHDQPMFALWLAMPTLLAVPPGLAWAVYRTVKRSVSDREIWWIYLAGVAASVFAVYLMWDASWVRYQYDLLFPVSLAAFSMLVTFFESIKRSGRTAILRVGAFAACAVFAWQFVVTVDQSLGLMFSRKHRMIYWSAIENAHTPPRRERAHLVRSALFDGLPRRIVTERVDEIPVNLGAGSLWCVTSQNVCYSWSGYDWERTVGAEGWSAHLNVTFPVGYTGQNEPLAVFGDAGSGQDAITVSSVDSASVRFSFFHDGARIIDGYEVPMQAGALRQIAIDMDPLFDRTTVHMDGALVLEHRYGGVYDHRAGPVVFGKGVSGWAGVAPAFSGGIVPARSAHASEIGR